MFINLGILVLSIILLFLTGRFYIHNVTYKNKDEVETFLAFLNKYITTTYYGPSTLAINPDFNTILVQPQSDYCMQSDTYKYFHPDVILQDTYTFREYPGVIKDALQQNYYDVIPKMKRFKTNRVIPHQYRMPLSVTLPYTYYDQLVHRFQVGKQSLCLFQKYNHLPQRASLSHKNQLMSNFYNYIDKMYSKGLDSDCIANATYLPRNYRLFHEGECRAFFEYLESDEYKQKVAKEGPQFITKKGQEVHRGKGITMLFPQETIELQQRFRNGDGCGWVKTLMVAQQYIGNPYLFKGHKIEFRVYWILASTNPVIAYAYDKTLIRRCIFPFDKFSTQKEAHVCNTAIVKNTLETMKTETSEDDEGDDGDEISTGELFIDWKLDYLQELLLKEGKIKDKNWLKNDLYPRIDRMLIHTIRSTQHTFANDSKLGEFFAADFLLTDDLQIHIMEINYNPQTLNTTQARVEQHTKMVQDMVEIQNAYLRSKYIRFKRIIQRVINQLSTGRSRLVDLVNRRLGEEIEKAYIDRIDSSFKLSSTNLFRLVMDENLGGTKQYKDLIQEKCLN